MGKLSLRDILSVMKNPIHLLAALVFVLIPVGSSAQYFEKPVQNVDTRFMSSMYVEVGGNAIIASVNYELIIDRNYAVRLGMAPGVFLSWNIEDNGEDSYYNRDETMDFVGLVSASKFFGSRKNKIETGIGFVFGDSHREKGSKIPRANGLSFTLGYRYMSLSERGLALKFAFTPIINSDGFSPWVGASIGLSLTNLFNNDSPPNSRSGY